MLKNLQVVGFRGISKLSLGQLGRVNLIVGKNNTGKTALLEAVEFLCARYTPGAWLRSPLRRGEVLPRFSEFNQAVEVRHLFHDRKVSIGSRFEISAEADASAWMPKQISVRAQIMPSATDGALLRDTPTSSSISPEELFLQVSRTAVQPDELIPISPEGWTWAARYPLLPCKLDQGGAFPIVYVSADSLTGDELIDLWDTASFEDRTDEVIRGLGDLFPNIQRLGPLGADGGHVRGNSFSVRMAGETSPNPLGSLGDGVRRLFAVLLAITEARGGFVLIDDIDTGLHHSVMRGMWQLVVKAAERLDIQVFATTHSSDCWQALGWLCATDPEIAKQVSVHRLERGLEHTVGYSPEELATAALQNMDIR